MKFMVRPIAIFCKALFVSSVLISSATALAQGTTNSSPDVQEVSRLVRAGQFQAAVDKANTVLVSKPKDALARFLKGVSLTELGKTNDAIAIFQSITEDNPELPEPYNNLAVLYASKGQFEKARTALELAIQTHPSYSTAHENLGDVYAKLASQAYDRALQLDKGNSGVQGKLGLIRDLFSTQPKAAQRPDASKIASATPPTIAPRVESVKAPEVAKMVALNPAPALQTTTAAAVAPAPMLAMPVAPSATPAAKAVALTTAGSVPATSLPSKATPPVSPATASAVVSVNENESVLAAVRNWAKVWSSRDAEGYIAAYAPDFKVDGGKSRRAWEAERRDRVASPSFIKVEVLDPVVLVSGDGTAEVKFRQTYNSDRLKDHAVRKTLTLAKTKAGWQITRERNG